MKSPFAYPAAARTALIAIALLAIATRIASADEAELVDPLEITEEMKDWIDTRVFAGQSETSRTLGLMLALNSLDLDYRAGQTGTAADVFATRKFNCVSFSFLFVGLSRHIGLKTHFLRAIDDPGYSKEGELVVVSEHMTAGIRDGLRDRVLEFRFLPDPLTRRFQTLSDEQAIALYYSNLGAERLFEGDFRQSIDYFEIATEQEPSMPELWVNLGVAWRRSGDHRAAEAAYLKALEVDPSDSRAYLNLASLMWRRGDRNATDRMLDLLEQGTPRDPYSSLVLGDHALRGRRFDAAKRFYRQAIRKDRSSGESRAALGLLLFKQGREKKAARQLRRALDRDPENPRTLELARSLEPVDPSEAGSSQTRE